MLLEILLTLIINIISALPLSFFVQAEKSPGPIVSRTRSWDSSSPVDRPELETASPTTRTRPVTRSMGTGDTSGLEVPSSPLRKAKRARLCSSSSSVSSPVQVGVVEHQQHAAPSLCSTGEQPGPSCHPVAKIRPCEYIERWEN